MNTKKLLTSVAVAATLSTSMVSAANASANALSFDANGDASVDISGIAQGSTFTDTFSFSLDNTYDIAAGTFAVKTKASQLVSFTSIGLYSSLTNNLITETLGGTIEKLGSYGYQSTIGLSAASLELGNYYVKVAGKAPTSTAGNYTFAANITPVPEPESYAMLLAGLGLMGTIARRRNKAKAS